MFFSGKNQIHIVDKGLDPSFDRTIIIDELSLKNLDNSDINNPADLLLALHVDKHSSIETKGTVRPFSPKVHLDLAGNIKNVHLPIISPYLSKYLGYIIQTGVLSLDYTFKADAGILDVDNDITIKNIKLKPDSQERIDQISKQLSMPLDSALSILRDKNNDVKLSIPGTGDIENPDFNLNDIMALADQRALGIQDYFVTQGISVERLFVCNPSISIEEEAKSIATLSL